MVATSRRQPDPRCGPAEKARRVPFSPQRHPCVCAKWIAFWVVRGLVPWRRRETLGGFVPRTTRRNQREIFPSAVVREALRKEGAGDSFFAREGQSSGGYAPGW